MSTQTIHFAPSVPITAPVSDPDPIVGDRVELQLLTTLKCNLKCTYCSLGVGEVLGSQTELGYDIDQLAAFIDSHLKGKEIYVTFYGGEPTLNQDMMRAVMARFPAFRYQLQTNGTLLDDLPGWVLAKLSNILVSIDGGEAITDGYRGRGIWRQVIRNLNHVHERVGGTITARVTWGNADTTHSGAGIRPSAPDRGRTTAAVGPTAPPRAAIRPPRRVPCSGRAATADRPAHAGRRPAPRGHRRGAGPSPFRAPLPGGIRWRRHTQRPPPGRAPVPARS